MPCDLHTHSTASDGTVAPEDLPKLAVNVGLCAIALTDHDTTAGIPACEKACREHDIAFVPGIEVSADPALPNWQDKPPHGTLHILGLFIQHDDPMLAKVHDQMRDARDERNPAIIEKLNTLGIDITYQQVQTLAQTQCTKIIGRPHIAQVLIEHGHATSSQDAFARYLGRGGAAYLRRDRLTAQNAINAIHHAGGLAILAHPVQLGVRDPDQLALFIQQLKQLGLDGIETNHPDHTPQQAQQFQALAHKLNLLTSGGSDFHGHRKDIPLGSQNIQDSIYEKLREAVKSG